MREIMICCPCDTDNEQGVVIIKVMDLKVIISNALFFGSLHIFSLNCELWCTTGVNREPQFQADQSSVVWSAQEFE